MATAMTAQEALSDPELEAFLARYGDGPPYLAEPADEVIWKLVNRVRAARRALGLEG